ncbi:isoleucine--tRNA ligase [Blyttiomyces sp. JEL0837]|nr:isoleucine--tRNA ligase [Blyttiomyces sp. JEL0837]
MVPQVPAHISFSEEEDKIIKFWDEIDAFKTLVKLSEGKKPYILYDCPPFATGAPGYGNLLVDTIKDTVARYAQQTGHHIERSFGWHCHGLPVEHQIDKKLGIKSSNDVMKMGIKAYNAECRSMVMKYSSEWEATVRRMGRLNDCKNGYKTLDTSYMESVWSVFKELYEKGQIYHGFGFTPYSTGYKTPLSHFEANLNLRCITDSAIVVSFPLVKDPSTAFLAWTNAPWTLPSNLALCVHPDFDYIKIKDEESGSTWILLESCLRVLYRNPKKANYTVLEKLKGADLKGLEYEPLFDYFIGRKGKGSFIVITDTYVAGDKGTGVVPCTPAFSESDFRVCKDHNVVTEEDLPCPIDSAGNFTEEVTDYKGMYIKDADKVIIKDFKTCGRLIRETRDSHEQRVCWASNTHLISRAVRSWFVRVGDVKEKLLQNNASSSWFPDRFKKRLVQWLEYAKDWSISRNRYWGTPLPLWISDDGEEIIAVGSVAELEQLTGVTGITHLHRDNIDDLTIPSHKGKGVLRRTPEVLDCWFESGCVPFAQNHHLFENKDIFNSEFGADLIFEEFDQTRGWLYMLLILSTHLLDKAPWKNIKVNPSMRAGYKNMRVTRRKEFPKPELIIKDYGADVFRLYLIKSSFVCDEVLWFDERGLPALVRTIFLPWYHCYRFLFAQLAFLKREHDFDFKYNPAGAIKVENVMDQWILASAQSFVKLVREEMAAYRLYTVVPHLWRFLKDLSNWYLRLNRKRLKGENGIEDSEKALTTLFEVLLSLSKLMVKFTFFPHFMAETMYQNLRLCIPEDPSAGDTRSVHFLTFPEDNPEYFNDDVARSVHHMQKVIELGRYIRDKNRLPLKTSLREVIVINPDPVYRLDIVNLESYIKDELNVRTVTITADEKAFGVRYELKPNFKVLGGRLGKDKDQVVKALAGLTPQQINEYVESRSLVSEGIEMLENDIKVMCLFDSSVSGSSKYEAKAEKGVLVILDISKDPALYEEGIARELINRVQRLRKTSGLQPTDDVLYYVKVTANGDKLESVLKSQADAFSKTLKQGFLLTEKDAGAVFMAQQEQEIGDLKFTLSFVKA